MSAQANDIWQEQVDEPERNLAATLDWRVEDAYWQGMYWSLPTFREGLDYEDYAAAFCVGYVGWAQYGGVFADAEKSLCANWVRIKGDARLEWDEALLAVRAAWDHAERRARGEALPQRDEVEEEPVVELADLAAASAQAARRPAWAAA